LDNLLSKPLTFRFIYLNEVDSMYFDLNKAVRFEAKDLLLSKSTGIQIRKKEKTKPI